MGSEWAWLDRITEDALQLATEAGLSARHAREILTDPVGWGFDGFDSCEGEDRNAFAVAEMLLSCAYSDLADVAAKASPRHVRSTIAAAADLWLTTATQKLKAMTGGVPK